VRALDDYRWLVLTSGNAARAVANAMGPVPRLPKALNVATSGPATTDVVRSLFPGTPIAASPTRRFGSPGLGEALALVDLRGARVLLPVSDRSPAAIARTLRERGAAVDVVVAYRTIPVESAGPALRAALEQGIDAITLASPSAVEAFVGLRGASRAVPTVVIGPTTEAAAVTAGLEVAETAEAETAEGLADAVERCLLGRRERS
jgi:uroporphyrinogen-III synthase